MFQLNITQEPASHLKKEYIQKFGYFDVFIETGTYLGDTIQLALEWGFKEIHSIELNEELYQLASEKFKSHPNVKLWKGDSIHCLPLILKQLTKPATFWLDAHASGHLSGGLSGGSPLLDELKIIDVHYIHDHTIFIDDRRLFGSAEWSFLSEKEVLGALRTINPHYKFLNLDGHIPEDILCATIRMDDNDENFIVW
jgi:hypothetical protein